MYSEQRQNGWHWTIYFMNFRPYGDSYCPEIALTYLIVCVYICSVGAQNNNNNNNKNRNESLLHIRGLQPLPFRDSVSFSVACEHIWCLVNSECSYFGAVCSWVPESAFLCVYAAVFVQEVFCGDVRHGFGLKAIGNSESFIQLDPGGIADKAGKNTHRYEEEGTNQTQQHCSTNFSKFWTIYCVLFTFQIIIWKIKSSLKNSNKSMWKCWNSEQMEVKHPTQMSIWGCQKQLASL